MNVSEQIAMQLRGLYFGGYFADTSLEEQPADLNGQVLQIGFSTTATNY